MSWTKKVTTTEEYDATGNLIKRVIVTEESGYPYVQPYYVGDPPSNPWWMPNLPTWTVTSTGAIAINDGNDEPDDGVGAKK